MSMRIERTGQTTANEHANSKSSLAGEADFRQALAKTQRMQEQELAQFLAKLSDQGQKLSKSLSLSDLADFRSLVKSFLRSTFGQSRQLQEETFWDYGGRPKVMARISRIDHALEELGRKVLTEQDKPLEILKKIDEIRGLIVDLFV